MKTIPSTCNNTLHKNELAVVERCVYSYIHIIHLSTTASSFLCKVLLHVEGIVFIDKIDNASFYSLLLTHTF